MANQAVEQTRTSNPRDSTNVVKPPYFDSSNYAYWKDRMEIWICSRDLKEWRAIKKGYVHPLDDPLIPISVFDQMTPKQLSTQIT